MGHMSVCLTSKKTSNCFPKYLYYFEVVVFFLKKYMAATLHLTFRKRLKSISGNVFASEQLH